MTDNTASEMGAAKFMEQLKKTFERFTNDIPIFLFAMYLTFMITINVGGCFIDSLALIMLTVPIFYPVVQTMGFDPMWFGVVIVLVTQIGVITPPVGINVYVVYGVAQGAVGGIPLEAIFKGILPFLIAIIVGTILMTLFPQIITLLPELMY